MTKLSMSARLVQRALLAQPKQAKMVRFRCFCALERLFRCADSTLFAGGGDDSARVYSQHARDESVDTVERLPRGEREQWRADGDGAH